MSEPSNQEKSQDMKEKKVHFNDPPQILKFSVPGPENVENIWYNASDYNRIETEVEETLRAYEDSQWDATDSREGDVMSMRGIEHDFEEDGLYIRKAHIRRYIRSALAEQNRRRAEGIKDMLGFITTEMYSASRRASDNSLRMAAMDAISLIQEGLNFSGVKMQTVSPPLSPTLFDERSPNPPRYAARSA